MTKSTIESTDTVNIEDIPANNLRNMLKGINREIKKLEKDRQIVASELERRGEKLFDE